MSNIGKGTFIRELSEVYYFVWGGGHLSVISGHAPP